MTLEQDILKKGWLQIGYLSALNDVMDIIIKNPDTKIKCWEIAQLNSENSKNLS